MPSQMVSTPPSLPPLQCVQTTGCAIYSQNISAPGWFQKLLTWYLVLPFHAWPCIASWFWERRPVTLHDVHGSILGPRWQTLWHPWSLQSGVCGVQPLVWNIAFCLRLEQFTAPVTLHLVYKIIIIKIKQFNQLRFSKNIPEAATKTPQNIQMHRHTK